MTHQAQAAALAWRTFMDEPASYVEPQRLAPCFQGAIGEVACFRLLATERLRGRLSTLLAAHYELPAPVAAAEIDEHDRTIALATGERLGEIARRAGAIRWSASLAGSVLAHEVQALHERLGEELCGFALANRDLASPDLPIHPIGGIAERIATDGWICLGAWCQAVPAAVASRVRLKLVAGALPESVSDVSFLESGPALIRRAAIG